MALGYRSGCSNAQELPNAEDAEEAQKSQKGGMEKDDLTARIIGAAVEVQRVFGTGLLESARRAYTASSTMAEVLRPSATSALLL
jgi:hypothetical protein